MYNNGLLTSSLVKCKSNIYIPKVVYTGSSIPKSSYTAALCSNVLDKRLLGVWPLPTTTLRAEEVADVLMNCFMTRNPSQRVQALYFDCLDI